MPAAIKNAIRKILREVEKLRKTYPKRNFTLDGRLVGDIGEVLAEEYYNITLFKKQVNYYDGIFKNKLLVQIKTTMKDRFTFPADHIPKYYLAIKVHNDGTFEEVYNGLGKDVENALNSRKKPKNNQYVVTANVLKKLQKKVKTRDRISKRR